MSIDRASGPTPADRVALLFEGSRRRRHRIVTPEGVALQVEIAGRGERVTAFLLDFLLWGLGTLFIYLGLLVSLLGGRGGEAAVAVVLFVAFVFRNVYFMHFELAWRGRTPGKRIVGLRVIDRAGGPLTSSAIVARNITREVEVFLPAEMILSLSSTTGAGTWAQLATLMWIAVPAVLPILNREHRRAGDLIAGTLVIAMPRRELAADLVDGAADLRFTADQLRRYGTFELQVLEELLRQPRSAATRRRMGEVAVRIRQRIGFAVPEAGLDDERFLRAFYAAERSDLERERLFGRDRADKDAAE